MKISVREPATESEWEAYRDLRWRVLRAPWGRPRGSERDPDDGESVHLAAFDEEGRVVGAGRVLFPSPHEAQARSMAVEPALQGKGVGAAVLAEIERRARERGARSVILHARENAVGFYKRQGYRVEAPSYVLFGVIPHFLMRKDLA